MKGRHVDPELREARIQRLDMGGFGWFERSTPRADVIHRQALLVNGPHRMVTWLPSKGLAVGVRVGPATVAEVYDLKMRKCAECGRLHTLDVVGCS